MLHTILLWLLAVPSFAGELTVLRTYTRDDAVSRVSPATLYWRLDYDAQATRIERRLEDPNPDRAEARARELLTTLGRDGTLILRPDSATLRIDYPGVQPGQSLTIDLQKFHKTSPAPQVGINVVTLGNQSFSGEKNEFRQLTGPTVTLSQGEPRLGGLALLLLQSVFTLVAVGVPAFLAWRQWGPTRAARPPIRTWNDLFPWAILGIYRWGLGPFLPNAAQTWETPLVIPPGILLMILGIYATIAGEVFRLPQNRFVELRRRSILVGAGTVVTASLWSNFTPRWMDLQLGSAFLNGLFAVALIAPVVGEIARRRDVPRPERLMDPGHPWHGGLLRRS